MNRDCVNPVFQRFLELRNGLPGLSVWKVMDIAVDEAELEGVKSWWNNPDPVFARQLDAVQCPDSMDEAKARLRGFSRASLTYDRRRLSRRWVLRKQGYGFSEDKCHACHATAPTVYHMQLCLNVDIDALFRNWEWRAAADAVVSAIRHCCPGCFYPSADVRIPVLGKRRGNPPDRGPRRPGLS